MIDARTAGRAAVLTLAALALGVAAYLYLTRGSFLLVRLASADRVIHSDFDSFWLSARALLDGGDIYRTGARYANLNPPLLTVLFTPFALLDPLPGYRMLVLVTVVLVIGSLAAVAAELRLPARVAVVATAAVLLSSPVLATLGLGQIYGLLAAGLAVAFVADRRGRPLLEGAALGLVVAVKPSLAPVLLLLVVRGRRRGLGAALATGVLATAAGALAAGPRSLPDWLGLLLRHPVQTYFDNASLPATLLRLTEVNRWGRPVLEVPGGFEMGLVLGLALLAATLWVVRRPPADGGPDAALWAVAAAALLSSPLTWHNYLMVLMPGVLVLLVRGRTPAAVLALSLSLIGMEWPPWWYAGGTASAVPLSLYCAVLLTYWAALLSGSGDLAARSAAVGERTSGSATVSPTAGAAGSGSAAAVTDRRRTAPSNGSGTSQSTPDGGSCSTAEAGRPCHTDCSASTAPRLPTPEPP